ncbi:hypothetical protein BH23ACI1_BH23ACI1_07870 [soil metagenome]
MRTTYCLRMTRSLVATKIRNQRTLLQRNHVEPSRFVLARMKQLAEDAAGAGSAPTLLGIEGSAARLYFEQFAGMLKPEDGDALPAFDFDGRNRRPPRDPINALLSFAYSLLAKDLTIVWAVCTCSRVMNAGPIEATRDRRPTRQRPGVPA